MAINAFAEQNASFLTWLDKTGATVSPSICIADFRSQDRGRGVVATRSIRDDEVLFIIPRSAVLLPSSITDSAVQSCIKSLENEDGELDPWLSLILVLVHEHLLGNESEWKPYLDLLPTTFDTPIFWFSDELSELQASSVVDKIGKTEADAQFRERLLPLIANLPNKDQIRSEDEALQLCHRMASAIMAYAFDIEPSSSAQAAAVDEEGYVSDAEFENLPKGMVPLADLLNADGTRNNARLYYEDDQLVMKSVKPIAEGEEIFNDYGELPRSDLLRRYGYVTDNYKQWDIAEIGLEDVVMPVTKQVTGLDDTEMRDRLALLEESDVLEESYAITRCDPESDDDSAPAVAWGWLLSQLPTELLVLLQTLLLPVPAYQDYKRRAKLPKPITGSSVKEASPVPVLDLARLLLLMFQRASTLYSSSLNDDYQLYSTQLEQGTLRRRARMALEVRIGEKEILAEAERSLVQIMGSRTGDNAETRNGLAEAEDGQRSSKRQRVR